MFLPDCVRVLFVFLAVSLSFFGCSLALLMFLDFPASALCLVPLPCPSSPHLQSIFPSALCPLPSALYPLPSALSPIPHLPYLSITLHDILRRTLYPNAYTVLTYARPLRLLYEYMTPYPLLVPRVRNTLRPGT